MARKRREGLGPRTNNRHLNLLNEIFVAAAKRRPPLVRGNPVPAVDRPKEPRRRWRILTPVEMGRIERAFGEMIAEAKGEERVWREQARVIFLVLVATGLRRGEILGVRWREVYLAEPDGPHLRVCETWVRCGEMRRILGESTWSFPNLLDGRLPRFALEPLERESPASTRATTGRHAGRRRHEAKPSGSRVGRAPGWRLARP